MIIETPIAARVVEHEQPSPVTLVAEAEMHFREGRHLQAACALQQALKGQPDDVDLLLSLGNMQFHGQDLRAALDAFTKAARLVPAAPAAHLGRAAVLLELGEWVEAEGVIRGVLSLEPTNSDALKLLCRVLLHHRQFKDSIPVCEIILKQQPSDTNTWLLMGRSRYELGDVAGARRAFEQALSSDPANEVAADNLSLLLKKHPVVGTPVRPRATPAVPVEPALEAGGALSRTVIAEIGSGDEMFTGDRDHYFGVGESALRCIDTALFGVRKARRQIRRILDLPCGHGRVMRFLKAAFPEAEITGCDLNRPAVDFCAKTFGATPVYSEIAVSKIPVHGTFDLIWSGSLLTHLRAGPCAEFVRWWNSLLEPGGLMIFTLHGRWVERNLATGRYRYGLPDERVAALLEEYKQSGFGYADYPGQNGYGISLTSPAYALGKLAALADLRLVSFHEKGWDNHQDVLCFQKQPASELLG